MSLAIANPFSASLQTIQTQPAKSAAEPAIELLK
jgi:hypothetical protein